MIPHTWFSES